MLSGTNLVITKQCRDTSPKMTCNPQVSVVAKDHLVPANVNICERSLKCRLLLQSLECHQARYTCVRPLSTTRKRVLEQRRRTIALCPRSERGHFRTLWPPLSQSTCRLCSLLHRMAASLVSPPVAMCASHRFQSDAALGGFCRPRISQHRQAAIFTHTYRASPMGSGSQIPHLAQVEEPLLVPPYEKIERGLPALQLQVVVLVDFERHPAHFRGVPQPLRHQIVEILNVNRLLCKHLKVLDLKVLHARV
jgi:hypothetical protein